MKIRPLRAELFRAARRTDMTKIIVSCRSFENAPTNGHKIFVAYFLEVT